MICTYIYTHPWDRFLGSNSKILLAPTPPMLKPRLEVSSGTASLRTLNPSSSTAHHILRFLRRAARGDHLAARHPTCIPASRRRDFRPRRKPRYPPQRARAGEGQGVLPGPSPRPRPRKRPPARGLEGPIVGQVRGNSSSFWQPAPRPRVLVFVLYEV
mmetsp:Transcript_5438/g.11198  ORF Transcript_5438/g.11198 Transcript_5438/m.11198 type:complete len:158 (+) Transcript_5438:331-804(+)